MVTIETTVSSTQDVSSTNSQANHEQMKRRTIWMTHDDEEEEEDSLVEESDQEDTFYYTRDQQTKETTSSTTLEQTTTTTSQSNETSNQSSSHWTWRILEAARQKGSNTVNQSIDWLKASCVSWDRVLTSHLHICITKRNAFMPSHMICVVIMNKKWHQQLVIKNGLKLLLN
jgi:hypothetical protein